MAEEFGVSTHAFLTRMDEPVGYAVGNALEIAESVECLRGTGSLQLRQLVCDCGKDFNDFQFHAYFSRERKNRQISLQFLHKHYLKYLPTNCAL